MEVYSYDCKIYMYYISKFEGIVSDFWSNLMIRAQLLPVSSTSQTQNLCKNYIKQVFLKCVYLVSYEHIKLKQISDQYLEQNNFVISFSNEDNESNFKCITFDNVFFLGLYVVDILPLYEVHH